MEEIENNNRKFILAVDCGSTNLVASIFDLETNLVADASNKIPNLCVGDGGLEINQEALWNTFVDTIKSAFKKADVSASMVKAFGFCTQRGTFCLWNKETGKPYCNFISWQDSRSRNVMERMNHSWTKKAINLLGNIMYTFIRQTRFLLMKVINFDVGHVSMKVIHFFEENPDVKEAAFAGNVLFGTIDTYIIWRLSKKKLHVTDFSCASGSSMFDPYLYKWSELCPILFQIPYCVFPELIETSGYILDVPKEIFGSSFPMTASAGDCQATVFGLQGFNLGDACATLGTGSFMMLNTGKYCHASVKGIYPQIGWKIKDELVNTCEGGITSIAPSVEWAKDFGIFEDVSELSDLAKSVEDTNGMYFVPAFGGLSAPHKDPKACTSLIGINRGTKKAHIARAICESIAFRFTDLYNIMSEESHIPFNPVIRVCGGVSNNNFIMELISAITSCRIERAHYHNMAAMGASFLAGLGAGVWADKEDIVSTVKKPDIIKSDVELKEKYDPIYREWQRAVQRCLQWYG